MKRYILEPSDKTQLLTIDGDRLIAVEDIEAHETIGPEPARPAKPRLPKAAVKHKASHSAWTKAKREAASKRMREWWAAKKAASEGSGEP